MNTTASLVSRIIKQLGGPTRAAEALNLSGPNVILNWRFRDSVPADRVMDVSAVTGIPPHELRPDVFRAPESAA